MPLPTENRTQRFAAAGLLAGIGLSLPLWFPVLRAAMPTVPVLSALRDPGFSAAGLIIAGIFAVLYPDRRNPRIFLLALLFLNVFFDLNRIQAWVWFYALLVSASIWVKKEEQRTVFQYIIAGVYFWGGVYKITPYFAEDNFDWFCDAYSILKPMSGRPFFGYLLAAAEAVLGLGLLWNRTRHLFRYLALFFHFSVVLVLSPWGLNWNLVVIPWNVFMAAIAWTVFAEKNALVLKTPASIAIAAITCLAPALNTAGFWPDAVSWKMYSNTQAEATFYAPAGAPAGPVKPFWDKNSFNNGRYMLLDDWAHQDLKTPLLPHSVVFVRTAQYLCGCTENRDSAGLYILTVDPYNRAAETMRFVPCSELQKMR